jgi:Na+/melibiose symporter-like transporter
MAAFGAGEAAGSFKNMAWGVLLLFYYQQIIGVEAALVGLAIGITMVADAITDPLVGAWSDRLHSRWGRRHPMLLASTVPLALSFVLLFNPPEGVSDVAGFIWLTVFGVSVRASYTFYNIPHLSLGAEMSSDYLQRSTLFAYQAFIAAMSVSVSYGLITGYYFPTTDEFDPGFLNPHSYTPMSLTFAAVMVGSIVLCVYGTRREIPFLRNAPIQERLTLRRLFAEAKELFGNVSFRAVFLGVVTAAVVGGVEGAFMPYMGVHFWGLRTEDLFYLTFVGLVAFPLTFVLIPAMTRWFEKKWAIIVATGVYILALNLPISLRLAEVSWFPSNESPWILPIFLFYSTIAALAAPLIGATANSMLADVADEHELDSGARREGLIYSARAFSMKAVGALGITAGGILLSAIEFPANAMRGEVPAEVVWKLGFVAGPATSVFSLAALGFYLGYRISRRRHQIIMAELSERGRQELAAD